MGNERLLYPPADEDDDESPSSNSSIPLRRKSLPLPPLVRPPAPAPRNEVIVPLGPPPELRFGTFGKPPLEAEHKTSEEDDDEDEEDETPTTTNTSRPADKRADAQNASLPPAAPEAYAEAQTLLEDEAEDTPDEDQLATPLTNPALPTARPAVPRPRQSPEDLKFASADASAPPPETMPLEQAAATWEPAAAEYQYQAAHEDDTQPQPLWGREGSAAENNGQASQETESREPEEPAGTPPSPPKPPAETWGAAEPPEEEPTPGPYDRHARYTPSTLPSFPAAERYVAASQREYAPRVEAHDRRVVPLLLGGLLFERALRKRADRKLEKRMNELMNRRHEDVLRTQSTLVEQQQQLRTEQRRQVQEIQRQREIQERFAARPAHPTRYEQPPLPPIAAPERPAASGREQQPPTEPAEEQQYVTIQPHQHEQQDAWRRYVVDEHGREVTGAVTYGEAYHQERQQEVRHDPMADSTASNRPVNSAAAASVGGVIMHSPQGVYQQYGSLPSGMTAPSLPSGQPTHTDAQHQLPAKNPMRSNIANPWFWLMLALIVAAFFTAALL